MKKNDAIQDYILKSERNLRIAAGVSDAWLQARETLVAGFLDRLTARLKKKLKGWDCTPWGGTFFVQAYPGYYLSKPKWEHYAVGFQCGYYGDRMDIGVARDTSDTRKLPLHPPLLSAVQKVLPAAKSTSWWEAQIKMQSPAPDWRPPEVLWRMHKDPSFLADVAAQLLQMAEITEPIIDKLSRKK